MTKTWTAASIDRAVEAATDRVCCPQCPPLSPEPNRVRTVGNWLLSVGAADVLVTVPSTCERGHRFILRVSLWSPAQTPVVGPRAKKKIEIGAPLPPRPLRSI